MTNSTPATGLDWRQQALHGLVEAQAMSEAITSLVGRLIDDGDVAGLPRVHATLEAVMACLQRQDRAVDPAVDAASRGLPMGERGGIVS
jgi:hypothetical protein